jgi:hypothetical protein
MGWISELKKTMQKDRKARYIIYTIVILLIFLLAGLGYITTRNAFYGKDVIIVPNNGPHLLDTNKNILSPVLSPIPSLKDTIKEKNKQHNSPIIKNTQSHYSNNTQKVNKVTKDIIDKVESISKDKNITVMVCRRSDENKSNLFVAKIVAALQKEGYINTHENGIIQETDIGGDPVKNAKRQSIINYSLTGNILTIIIPSNK